MALQQVTWYNDGKAPEGVIAPALDADNLNRIESRIQEALDMKGTDNVDDSENSIVGGALNQVSGSATEEVTNGTATGGLNAVFGAGNIVKATQYVVGGKGNQVGDGSTIIFQGAVFGANHTLKDDCSQGLVSGQGNTVSHSNVTSVGNKLISTADNQFLCGKWNNASNTGLLIVGKGSSSSRSNAFRVAEDGKVYGGTYNSTGADYAEYFEWEDGNTDNETRKGRFVTLADEDKIRYATAEDDFILGILSANASVIGNSADEEWHDKYIKDVYGEYQLDENGEMILNPEYDDTKVYITRSQRPEWAIVGLIGQIIMDDDGTCIVGKCCYPSSDGIATLSENGYRVLKRIDDTHIKVLFG